MCTQHSGWLYHWKQAPKGTEVDSILALVLGQCLSALGDGVIRQLTR